MLSAGERLGAYELLAPLAKGGMAEVWAARHRETHLIVAIKTILANAADDAKMLQMFARETRLAACVQHPNVVSIVDHGQGIGQPFLAMEWVHGEPLRYILHAAAKHQGLPHELAVYFIAQACLGLHAAHEARSQEGEPLGIVHRDVSPHNILISYAGIVKLADFGIAQTSVDAEQLTARGELKGKLTFMSPEQVRELAVDRRSDIFSMAGILYWALIGNHPFSASTAEKTRNNLLNPKHVLPPSTHCSEISKALDNVLMKALAYQAPDRFSTAAEFHDALQRALPAAFRPGIEQQAAEFVTNLFGSRPEERLAHLQFAQQVVDTMHDNNPPASSALVVDLSRSPEPSTAKPLALRRGRALGAALLAAACVTVATYYPPDSDELPPRSTRSKSGAAFETPTPPSLARSLPGPPNEPLEPLAPTDGAPQGPVDSDRELPTDTAAPQLSEPRRQQPSLATPRQLDTNTKRQHQAPPAKRQLDPWDSESFGSRR